METKRYPRGVDETDRQTMAERRLIELELQADPDNEFLWDLLMNLDAA